MGAFVETTPGNVSTVQPTYDDRQRWSSDSTAPYPTPFAVVERTARVDGEAVHGLRGRSRHAAQQMPSDARQEARKAKRLAERKARRRGRQ